MGSRCKFHVQATFDRVNDSQVVVPLKLLVGIMPRFCMVYEKYLNLRLDVFIDPLYQKWMKRVHIITTCWMEADCNYQLRSSAKSAATADCISQRWERIVGFGQFINSSPNNDRKLDRNIGV